jgi:hypothetical protein
LDVTHPEGPTPGWVKVVSAQAAEALYREMERIDGEAMNDAQVEQDAEAGRFTWTWEVARIIADTIRAHPRMR